MMAKKKQHKPIPQKMIDNVRQLSREGMECGRIGDRLGITWTKVLYIQHAVLHNNFRQERSQE